jgi:hypothetical protein
LLLRDPALKIVALVDAQQRESVERAAVELRRVAADVEGRFRCLTWYPDAPDLGLTAPVAQLCADVGMIVDLTDLGAPCSTTLPPPMPESLRLASHCPQLHRFDFLSSAFVSGDRRGLVAEFDFGFGQGFKNSWEERLYARERAVRVASLPVTPTIYRPIFLVGDSRTGEIERFTGAYAPLLLIERLHDMGLPVPMIGRGTTAAPIVPVDYVAAAIARLIITPQAAGQTFHLADPDAPTIFVAYRRAAILLTGRAPAFGLDPRLARRLLRSRFGRQWDISPVLVDYLDWPITYRTANSHALLAPVGIVPPSFADYSAAVIEFFADHCDDPRFGARLA